MLKFSLGFSPCPNDTYIFYALTHGLIETGDISFAQAQIYDVETLNAMALSESLDVTKVSFYAYLKVREHYALLKTGGAMGRSCGPLIVSKKSIAPHELKGKKIAVPGKLTTAYLLTRLFEPEISDDQIIVLPFNDIMAAVRDGTADAGVIIHECRFTYHTYGLTEVIDLGMWWEKETALPVPLGCIIAKKSLGERTISKIEQFILQSVLYAKAHPVETLNYIRSHAAEMDDKVISGHIALYVNNYTENTGADGAAAFDKVIDFAKNRGLL
ncbi:MAG: 1,4-dihydroxy-6-naphthoate synthase [Nitrospirae bacterium]|nr:1,4-dihydroxy-6-naphthoate synthase [Nitrospirota bacterium]MBF0535711.1 1,4-dihydroxy-6-naphthoate synthase [Nitrospirota bacterium]MBF0617536.1 1,4-dihydroxy-6-naphthoate synthase [Nitrospirota bacterium]